MVAYRLVVSNPPQNGVNADEAARILGLTPEEVIAKARYTVPEIWFAHPDPERAADAALALSGAGCRVALASSETLASLPARGRVRSFAFTETAFVAHTDGGEAVVPYEEPVVGVFCRPRETANERASGPRTRRSSGVLSYRDVLLETSPVDVAGVPTEADQTPFLDLYVGHDGSPHRLTVIQNAVSFAGLGRVQPRAAANMDALVGSCEDRFRRGAVDRRLVGMRLRFRAAHRAPGSEHRRGFSFASPGLQALLRAVANGLEHVTQAELSTRLAYLTQQPH